jgi:hypothetical protein
MRLRVRSLVACSVLLALVEVAPSARQAPSSPNLSRGLFQACCSHLGYRMIGPFRGGRTKAATGVPGQPNVFYIGACNGGVWKSTDYGRVWTPIFDDQPTGSIAICGICCPSRRPRCRQVLPASVDL